MCYASKFYIIFVLPDASSIKLDILDRFEV